MRTLSPNVMEESSHCASLISHLIVIQLSTLPLHARLPVILSMAGNWSMGHGWPIWND